MTESNRLHLYEEILLLALRNDKDTLMTSYANYVIAGALLAEMMLEGRIVIEDSWRKYVEVRDRAPFGDPVLDEALARMADSRWRASLKAWIRRLAGAKRLRHRVAQGLCRRGILRADEDTVLLFFRRKIYPELNPLPEQRIIERMRTAIVLRARPVDPRTSVLISLAKGIRLLTKALGRDTVRDRKDRIKEIVRGEAMGKATKEVVEACEAAVAVGAVVAAAVATSHH